MLRQKAEARMLTGSGLPDEFAPVLRMQNAALAEDEKTLALASLRNTLAFPGVSAQMRGYRCAIPWLRCAACLVRVVTRLDTMSS